MQFVVFIIIAIALIGIVGYLGGTAIGLISRKSRVNVFIPIALSAVGIWFIYKFLTDKIEDLKSDSIADGSFETSMPMLEKVSLFVIPVVVITLLVLWKTAEKVATNHKS